MLLEEHRLWTSQLEAVEKAIVQTVLKVDHVEKLLAIKGVGVITIAGFIAEVGDIRRFSHLNRYRNMQDLSL
jgi:transposase